MIVVDASAALSALLHSGAARDVLTAEQLHVPHLVDSELAAALRRLVARRELESDAGWAALDTWSRAGVLRHPVVPLVARVWALRANLSAYDAAYVALAESLGCSLVTADARISRASGLRCPVTVVPH